MGLLATLGLKPRAAGPQHAGPAPAGDAAPAGERADTRADLELVLSQITALVLGGIDADGPRKRINDELAKLKAGLAKADKLTNPKSATTALNALLTQAQALHARADRTKAALDLADARLAPLATSAKAGLAGVAAGPKAVLQKELEALEADIQRYAEAGDDSALQAIVLPRLTKLAQLAGGFPKAAAQADADLALAAKRVGALDEARSAGLRARLQALQDQRKSGWPAGNTLDEIAASMDAVTKGAKALIEEAEALALTIVRDREIAALRRRVDALKPRTDKASEKAAASFIEARQKKVRDALADFARFEAAANLKSCEVIFSQLGAALDSLEQARQLHAAHRARFVAARDGGVKAALALKLQPASLAALRTKSIDAKRAEIEKLADVGQLFKADSTVVAWLQQAKTWGASQATYNNIRSGHPKVGAMRDLIEQPGGGEVFDAIVADLPDDTAAVNVTAAIEARFDIDVKQFNHRKSKDADGKVYPDKSKELNPKAPQKGMKDLYKVLRMVPVKDVKYTEKIVHYDEDGGGAYFQPGLINDKIVLYAGRPDDATNTVALGNAAPPGETPDPTTAPVGGAVVNYFNFAALHEVAHGVDDARGVMKSRLADAGWESHGTGHIAKKVAGFFDYDADYIESMMDSKSNTPPKKRPPRPAHVKTDAEWDSHRRDAEQWVTESRTAASPWYKPALAKKNAIGGRVYQEAYEGDWVSYHLAARTKGISNYQFRAPGEWFAELYATFHFGKLNPKHPAAGWLQKLKVQSGG